MGLYEVSLFMSLLGFGMGTTLANLLMSDIMVLGTVLNFKHAREEFESKIAYVF